MDTIIVEAEAAAIEREALLRSGREVEVMCHRRDHSGVVSEFKVSFGCSSDSCWVVHQVLDEAQVIDTCMELAQRTAAEELFSGYVERVSLTQQLIDPSPLAPDMCELTPSIERLVADIEATFGIVVAPRI